MPRRQQLQVTPSTVRKGGIQPKNISKFLLISEYVTFGLKFYL